MPQARKFGLIVVLACSALSVWWGCSLGWSEFKGPLDFQAIYYGARALIEHHDPYNISDLDKVYLTDSGERQPLNTKQHKLITLFVNTPGTVLLVAPFAVQPLVEAQMLWMVLTAGSLVLASVLMWNQAGGHAPILATCLIGFLLLNCQVVIAAGNTAAIVVGLCVIACWCFVQNRFVVAGVLCMAISLVIKPHDSGLVFLYFLIANRCYRRRALQCAILTVAISLVAILWLSSVAPGWLHDWQANLAAISAPGGMNDPRPSTVVGVGAGNVISLQAIFSVISENPGFYNVASYIVCGALLIPWAITTLRYGRSQAQVWVALAVIAPLSMLITYHRAYDAKLLLLCIPACTMLWARRGRLGSTALVLTSLGIVVSSDIPLAALGILLQKLQLGTSTLSGKVLTILIARPNQEILFAMSLFYLWVYMRDASVIDGCRLPDASALNQDHTRT